MNGIIEFRMVKGATAGIFQQQLVAGNPRLYRLADLDVEDKPGLHFRQHMVVMNGPPQELVEFEGQFLKLVLGG